MHITNESTWSLVSSVTAMVMMDVAISKCWRMHKTPGGGEDPELFVTWQYRDGGELKPIGTLRR